MKRETELQVQAWLDGELAAGEVAKMQRMVETEPALSALAAELKSTRARFVDGELTRNVPVSREFYWSQIERQILRPEPSATTDTLPRHHALAGWLRWLAPAAIVAILALLLVSPERSTPQHRHVRASEVESPLDGLGSFTFHSDSEQMNVVWVGSF